MVFSIDTINKMNESLSFDNEIIEDSDLFFEACELCLQEDSNMIQTLNSLDEGIISTLLKDNDVREGLKSFDITTIFEKIFDWFVSAIGKMLASFRALVTQILMGANTELRRYKDQLLSYHGESIRYSKGYYDYQHIDIDTSVAVLYKEAIENVYNNLLGSLEKAKNSKDKDQIIDILKSALDNEIPFNYIRGKLVGLNTPVSPEDYKDVLFTYFRTTEKPKKNKNGIFRKELIDAKRIQIGARDYFNGANTIRSIDREASKYKAEANGMKMKIKGASKLNMIRKESMQGGVLAAYNELSAQRCRDVKVICDIFLQFLSAKMNAVKEYNKTNRDLLLIVCKHFTRDKYVKD